MSDFVAKQSTAITVVAGPFRDVTNVATKLTALTITPSDVQIRKEGSGSFGAKSEASNASHLGDGYYLISFNTTDINTKGTLFAEIDMTGAFPVDFTIEVVDADEWERRYGTGASTQDILTAIQKLHSYPIHEDTVDTVTANDQFIMNTGSAINDIYIGMLCVLIDSGNSDNIMAGIISDYIGADNEIFLHTQSEPFTLAPGDTVRIYYPTAANLAKWLDVIPAELTSTLVQSQANQFGSTAQTSLNTLGTQIRGSDNDNLKNLSDQLDAFSVGTTPLLLQNTTIATLASQTSFAITSGSDDNDAYQYAIAIFTDQSTPAQKSFIPVASYSGATKTVTLTAAPKFTIAVGDTIDIVASTVNISQLTDIENDVDTIKNLSTSTNSKVLNLPEDGSFATIAASVANTEQGVDEIRPKMGTFVSLGSGANLSANLQDLAGSLIDPGIGGGPHTVVLTFLDSDTNDPIENLAVRMKASAADDLRGVTDENGQVTFYCQDATYTITARIANYTLDDMPITLAVSGDATPTAYTMTAVTVTPSEVGQTTLYLVCLDETNQPETDVTFTLRFKSPPAGESGFAYDRKPRTATSDVNGLVQFTGEVPGASYSISRTDDPVPFGFVVDANAGSSWEIPSFSGRD